MIKLQPGDSMQVNWKEEFGELWLNLIEEVRVGTPWTQDGLAMMARLDKLREDLRVERRQQLEKLIDEIPDRQRIQNGEIWVEVDLTEDKQQLRDKWL